MLWKVLLQSCKKRFGGNAATKKTQRNLLKQQYENLTTSSSVMLNQTFDMLQKLVRQLELLEKKLSQEDVNQKLLRSLSLEWNTHVVVRRNKADLNTMSMDDLYNNLKSDQAEEGPNYALMAFSSSSSESKGNPQINLQDQRVIDSGCSRHMTGSMSYIIDYEEIDRGYVAFRGNPKEEKKEKVPLKLVLLRVPRKNNMYSVDLKNIVPKGDHIGKFDGNADEAFFVGYTLNSKAFRAFNNIARIVEENLHISFSESTPNVVGNGPDWLFDIDALTRTMNYEPIVTEKEDNVNSTNNVNTVSSIVNTAGTKGINNDDENIRIELLFDPNMPALEDVSTFDFSSNDEGNGAVTDMNNLDTIIQMSSTGELTFFLGLQVKQKKDITFISQDKYVAEILKKFGFTEVKTASTPMETQKPLLKDEDGEEVYQVNVKFSHLYVVIRIFRYLKGQPKLGLWYPKDSPFDLIAYTDSDYAGASLDQKPSTGDALDSKSTTSLWTIDGDVQLHAQVDGKEMVIIESSVRRDLQLVDEEDKAVHKELGNSLVRAATTASSLEAEQDSGNITKTQSQATPNESSSQGTYSGGGPRCQEAMGDTISQTRFQRVSKQSNDLLLARGNTLQSDKDRLELNELIALCTNLQNRVLDLEKTKTTQRDEIDSLKRRVKKFKKRNRSRTHKLKRTYIVGLSARVESSRDEESLGGDEVFVVGKNNNVVKEVVAATHLAKGKEKKLGEELEQKITKKQKVEDNKEKAELK
nr:hypothetical protein [Tanacetum cinerariifolium]